MLFLSLSLGLLLCSTLIQKISSIGIYLKGIAQMEKNNEYEPWLYFHDCQYMLQIIIILTSY